jgi:alkylation response protein AidB-like acyl-CoA dehydrogenase
MQLSPTAEQQAIKDSVRRFCQEQVTPERLAAWEREPDGIDDGCWRAIGELGWFALGLPAAAGGSGLGLVEVACLLEECGRGLIPHRVINGIRAALALARLDDGNPRLPALARGDATLALAFDEQHARQPGAYRTELSADGTRLSGEKWYLADPRASWHLVAARKGEDIELVLVEAASARLEPLRTFDGERQAIARYDAAPVVQRFGGTSSTSLASLRREQAALALAEMVGGMAGALDMTVAYVKDREQFGQKIAVFQAVQHQIADMATLYTAARHLAWQAITRLTRRTLEGNELAVAAAFVGQACKRVTLAAHHLHGGAGYVVEHPLHYYAERAQSLCIRYAPEAAALAEVAASLLDSGR